MNALPNGDSLLLLGEVAAALRVSVKTIRRLVDDGKLKSQKIRGRILIRATEVMNYLNGISR